MRYTVTKSVKGTWVVGVYDDDGVVQPVSYHPTKGRAAAEAERLEAIAVVATPADPPHLPDDDDQDDDDHAI